MDDGPMDHVMRIQDPVLGDELLTWDPNDPESVKNAKKRFDALVGQKHAGENAHAFNAYEVEHTPRAVGEPITEFDPEAGEILLVAAMAGG